MGDIVNQRSGQTDVKETETSKSQWITEEDKRKTFDGEKSRKYLTTESIELLMIEGNTKIKTMRNIRK